MKCMHVVGARPNFMKAAPVLRALDAHPEVRQILVHTGQHYDRNMSDIFFDQLGMRAPDLNLEVGSGSHAVQTAQVMTRFEEILLQDRPDWVLVYGDINSTMAATIASSKLGVRVAHVEAGLRSFDRTMPEELNRLVTDQLADLLLTPSLDGNANLMREGIPEEKIHFVGNVMIDTLVRLLPQARRPDLPGLADRYILATLHRPSNVDDPAVLPEILETLHEVSREIQVVFPIHPRTRAKLKEWGLAALDDPRRVLLLEPLGYLEFLALQAGATIVMTDSGGIQEETTYLGIPCLTLRENTERPITVTEGTNCLVGRDMGKLKALAADILAGRKVSGKIPTYWDGHAGVRIAQILTRMA